MRFDIAYGRLKWLMIATGMRPSTAFIDVDDSTVTVKMGWAFRATIARSSITGVRSLATRTISIGVHGWRGRWLVNGAGDRLVTLDIDPPTHSARAVFFPIKLRQLTMSVENRDEFVRALTST